MNIHKNLAANFILRGELLNASLDYWKWGKKYPNVHSDHFSIVLEVKARAIMQEKEINDIKLGKKDGKLFPFVNDMIIYTGSLKKATV